MKDHVVKAEHIGAVYELTGPTVLDIDGLAAQYSRALGRTVTGQRLDVEDWEGQLERSGLDGHVREHIATMARLHAENRYDRHTDTVESITGTR